MVSTENRGIDLPARFTSITYGLWMNKLAMSTLPTSIDALDQLGRRTCPGPFPTGLYATSATENTALAHAHSVSLADFTRQSMQGSCGLKDVMSATSSGNLHQHRLDGKRMSLQDGTTASVSNFMVASPPSLTAYPHHAASAYVPAYGTTAMPSGLSHPIWPPNGAMNCAGDAATGLESSNVLRPSPLAYKSVLSGTSCNSSTVSDSVKHPSSPVGAMRIVQT
ncbi:uncharacterized protein LOC117289448 [Asterias rubens]|uniref:uncharacterized protein LOC117289448 n=1 Tax=Asterias rubens TaxID=7604 RepID=UPI00145568FC|nr:uncharacterized protein LOC117289448 [Asterias rubens]